MKETDRESRCVQTKVIKRMDVEEFLALFGAENAIHHEVTIHIRNSVTLAERTVTLPFNHAVALTWIEDGDTGWQGEPL
jgi:hypothetical protein